MTPYRFQTTQKNSGSFFSSVLQFENSDDIIPGGVLKPFPFAKKCGSLNLDFCALQ